MDQLGLPALKAAEDLGFGWLKCQCCQAIFLPVFFFFLSFFFHDCKAAIEVFVSSFSFLATHAQLCTPSGCPWFPSCFMLRNTQIVDLDWPKTIFSNQTYIYITESHIFTFFCAKIHIIHDNVCIISNS